MADQTPTTVTKELFIPAEHRPESRPNLAKYPPLRPEATYEEIRRCAYDVLEDWRREELIAANTRSPAEIWNIIPARNSEVIWEVLDDEAVLLNLETAVYYSLNTVGTVFWELCDSRRSMQDILLAIKDIFDAPESVLRDDLAALAPRLYQENLLEGRSSDCGTDQETVL